jgi:RNA-directed DNA polymerase
MIKPSVNLQELRRRIYRKAKAEKSRRFWGFYVHVSKVETLRAAYQAAKANDGTPESMERVFSPSKPKG